MTPDAALEAIGSARVVAVVRAQSARKAVEVAQAVYRGGIRVVEIAMTTPGAAAAIREVCGLLPDAVVGAGTVRSTPDVIAAVGSGAAFVASPGTSTDVIDGARRAGVLAIPGVLTPTEVERAAGLAPLLGSSPLGPAGRRCSARCGGRSRVAVHANRRSKRGERRRLARCRRVRGRCRVRPLSGRGESSRHRSARDEVR